MTLLKIFKSKCFSILSFLIFFTSLASALTLPYQSLFLYQHLGVGEAQIGLFVSASSISNIIISFIFAYISDHYVNRKLILSIGLVSAIISYFLYTVLGDFNQVLLVSIFVMGISACITPQLFALSHQMLSEDKVEEHEINSNMTLLRTMISISWAVGPLVGAYFLEWFGFSGLFLITGLMFLLAFIIVLTVFKNTKINKSNNINKKEERTQEIVEEKSTSFLIVFIYFIIFVLVQMVSSMIDNIFPIYITQILGYSNSYIGVISSFSAVVEIPLMIYFAMLSRRFELTKLLNVGFVACLLFLVLFSMLDQIILIIGIYALKSLFYSVTIGLGMSFFQNMIPNKVGISTTLFINTSSFGKIISGIVIGVLGNSYNSIFIFLIFVIIVCIIIFNTLNLRNVLIERKNL